MSNHFKPWRQPEYCGHPIGRGLAVCEYRESDYLSKYRATIDAAPYRPDDLVWFALPDGKIAVGRIYSVGAHWQEGHGYYIPSYRVVYATVNGRWSRNWRRVYPGDIYRAWHDKAGKERRLPAATVNQGNPGRLPRHTIGD